jgi:hypothetical protein
MRTVKHRGPRKRSKLEQQIEDLEKQVADMEARAEGWSGFEEKFITAIEEEFGGMINAACDRMAFSIFSGEDIKQEFIEYLLRYCLRRARQFTLREESNRVWIPYLYKSVRNCYVNLLANCSRVKRSHGQSLEVLHDSGRALFSQYARKAAHDPDGDIMYDALVEEIYLHLGESGDKDVLKMYCAMIDPKPSLLRITRKFSRGKVRISNKAMSAFFGWSPTKTSSVYSRLKKEIKHLLNVRNVVDESCTRS